MPRITPKKTKKFITKHLKDTIDRRKQFAKIKQRNQLKEKRRDRKASENGRTSESESQDDLEQKKKSKKTSSAPELKDMSMDDFFQSGFMAIQASESRQEKADESEKTSSVSKRKRDTGLADDETKGSSSGEDGAFAEAFDEASEDEESDADQVAAHKNQLNALAEKDPEFYNYLKENDAELLDFTASGDTFKLSDDEEERPKKRSKNNGGIEKDDSAVLSVQMVKKWSTSMAQQNSQTAMREVILAFRAAAHTNEDEGKSFKYTVSDADSYHEILVTALKGIPTVLSHHLPIKETASGKVRVPTDSKKFRTFSPMLNSHAISIAHLLENLSDTKAINMVVSSLQPLIPYFLSFKKSLKNLLKGVIGIWADPSSAEATRVNCFLLLKRLAVISDTSLREAVLKSTYQGLVRSSRNTTVHTLAGINLMKNSAADLWGLDPSLSYTTGFMYIRQLAIHLRTSITQPSKESYKAIYNWQYTHSLDFWSRVLSHSCSPAENSSLKQPSDSPLHPLIYPLVQVTLGALRLVPSPSYFPLRFQLTRSLLRISRTTNTYVPLAPSLLEVLQSPEMRKVPKNSTLKPLDFDVVIRAPESYLKTRVYQDGLAEQLSELILEFFGVWSRNIAFPELAIPPLTVIKRWLKEVSPYGASKSKVNGTAEVKTSKGQGNRNGKANSLFSLLAQKIQANAAYVEENRRNVDFAVNDRKGVDAFMRDVEFEDTPIGAYVATIRRQKEERARMLNESRKEEEARRKEESSSNYHEHYSSTSDEESTDQREQDAISGSDDDDMGGLEEEEPEDGSD